VTKVPFDNLPDTLQKQYNYDPAKVAADSKAAEEANKAEAARAAAAEREREQIARREADERRAAGRRRLTAEQRQKTIENATLVMFVMVGVAVGLWLYFVPSIVGRHKANALAIFVCNLFLGWTFLGWVLALVWACTKDSVIETHEQAGDFKE